MEAIPRVLTTSKGKFDAYLPVFESIEEVYDLEGEGFCLSCGETQCGCEPDARGYECESCGAKGTRGVYGIEELFIMGLARITGD